MRKYIRKDELIAHLCSRDMRLLFVNRTLERAYAAQQELCDWIEEYNGGRITLKEIIIEFFENFTSKF